MVDLRRILLLVAAVALLSTLALAQTPASQGITCTVNAAVPTIIRDNANADQAGDIYISCTGGVPTAFNEVIPHVNIQVFFTAPVTSKVVDLPKSGPNAGQQKLESILIVDELRNADNSPRMHEPCDASSASDVYNAALDRCDTRASGFPSESYLGEEPTTQGSNTGSKPNIFQAISVPGATSSSQTYSLAFYGVPFDPPGTLTTRILRITNVRLQSGGFASGGGIPAPIVASVNIQNTQGITLTQNTATVATVQKALTFDTTGKQGFLQCESQSGTCPSFTVNFHEAQQAAFRKRNGWITPDNYTYDVNDLLQEQNNPGALQSCVSYGPDIGCQGTEDMFTDEAFTGTVFEDAGVAKYGTRLLARFTNVPQGVHLLATTVSANFSSSYTDGIAKAILVPDADYNGDGGGMDPDGDQEVASDCTTWPSAQTARNLSELQYDTVDGSNVAWGTWEIVDADPGILQTVSFGIVVQYTADTSEDKPEVRDDTSVIGHMAPLDQTSVPATFSTAPAPRFNPGTESKTGIINIARCRTNLLYPFVAQYGGPDSPADFTTFDTGIAIANTSADPFDYTATTQPTPRAQKGACKIYYYGTTGESDDPPPMATTPVIQAGKVYAFGLYGGSADGNIPPARNFEGYIIAVCDFQFAHGYAFLSNYGGGDYAQGYVALVMDADMYTKPAFTRTRTYSEPFNQ